MDGGWQDKPGGYYILTFQCYKCHFCPVYIMMLLSPIDDADGLYLIKFILISDFTTSKFRTFKLKPI